MISHTETAPLGLSRNPGMPRDLDWVESVRVNASAVERRAATLVTRRTVKKEWQAAWLLREMTCIDLTTLSGDDTSGNVARLCSKAKQPVRKDLLDAMEVGRLGIKVGAVCVYHEMVEVAVRNLRGSGVPVAAVSAGFPAGLNPLPQRMQEIEGSVAAGGRRREKLFSRAHGFTRHR